jgi:hypothetical protein
MMDADRTAPLLGEAAEAMLAASRTILEAASALTGGAGARERELTAEAVEVGFLRALQRESLLGEQEAIGGGDPLVCSAGGGLAGTGYGRMGATITGHGQRAQTYGAIGGAIGYAVAGPIGGLLGGMLGGLFGGDDDQDEQQRQEELRRQWLNDPTGFEVEAYLYNLTRAYAMTGSPPAAASETVLRPWMSMSSASGAPVVVNMHPGAVQITGQGEEAGQMAARAFAGALGRALQLNSVVVPAAGWGV